jgi:hypothetical protein
MPTNKQIDYTKLYLDLKNYRTVPQKTEKEAIQAMIATKGDRFFAVLDSILEDEYLYTENLIVLEKNGKYIVKEGNRRMACMKLIHGQYDIEEFGIPESSKTVITKLSKEWKMNNRKIPCAIFQENESEKANKIVNLTHAKNEKASRDPWSAVAKARHNRDEKGGIETSLDLLELYLKEGKNHNSQQRERWSGVYPLTVLEDALRYITVRMGFHTVNELLAGYKKNRYRSSLESIILEIGLGLIQFKHTRNPDVDFAEPYGIPKLEKKKTEDTTTGATGATHDNSDSSKQSQKTGNSTNSDSTSNKEKEKENENVNGKSTASETKSPPAKAVAIDSPKHVYSL